MNAVQQNHDGRNPEASEGSGGAQRKIILLVEDNEADRDMYGGLLWYNGYEVVHAADGAEALEKAATAAPDLALLDIMLPGELSGLDVAVRLRESGLDIPMIVLSAVAREDLGPVIAAAGITAYLEKPIDPFSVVKEVMRRVGRATGERD